MQNLKKFILLKVLLILTTMPCYAFHAFSEESVHPDQHSDIVSSISMQFAGLSGLTNEFAYNNGNKISELDWQLQPLFLLGSTINTQFLKMFFLNIGYWSGINKDLGIINDYDYATVGTVTNFSRHDCKLQKAQFLDLNAGYTQRIVNDLSITGILGYNSMDLKMSARDGYYEYPPGSVAVPLYGTTVATEQTFNIPYIGLGVNWEFYKIFYAQLMTSYSWIIMSNTIDFHYRRLTDFFSFMKSGQQFSLMVTLGWKINSNASLVLSVEYTKITTVKGESYSTDLNTGLSTVTSPNTASTSYNATSVALSLEHSIRWLYVDHDRSL